MSNTSTHEENTKDESMKQGKWKTENRQKQSSKRKTLKYKTRSRGDQETAVLRPIRIQIHAAHRFLNAMCTCVALIEIEIERMKRW